MMWNPNTGYNGSVLSLLEDLFERFYPRPSVAAKAQAWIISELERGIGPYVYRHSADIRAMVARIGNSKPRYYFGADFKKSSISFDVIASDNEANSSFFSSLLGPNPALYDHNFSILDAFQKRIKVGILRKAGTPKVEQDAFRAKAIQTAMNDHPLRPAVQNLQLDHIFDAGRQIHLPFGDDQLKQRCFRLLTPLNVFPFPSSKKYIHKVNGVAVPNGIGSTPQGQGAFLNFLFIKFCRAGEDSCLVQYFSQFNTSIPSLKAAQEYIDGLGTMNVQILPKVAGGKSRVGTGGSGTSILVRESNVSVKHIEFFIQESMGGKFHLSNFGVTFGGRNRDRLVVFVVKDAKGRELKRSNPTTSKDLGIAARARGDYDQDRFHQTNILIRDEAGRIVPHSSLGRKIPWI